MFMTPLAVSLNEILTKAELLRGVSRCCGEMPDITDFPDPRGATEREIFCRLCRDYVDGYRAWATIVWNRRKDRPELNHSKPEDYDAIMFLQRWATEQDLRIQEHRSKKLSYLEEKILNITKDIMSLDKERLLLEQEAKKWRAKR